MIKEVRNRIKKLFASFTLLSLGVVILLITFGGALLAFLFIARMIFKDDKRGFDDEAFKFLSGFVSDVNTNVMEFFTFLGTHTFLIPVNFLLVAYFLFLKKHRWYSISIPVIALSSLLLMFSLKYIFRRDRPLTPLLQEARGYSFPSGHALISFTFYGLLIYLVWLNVKSAGLKWLLTITLVLLIFVIGLSRVYLRVHYASDVIAGYCIGCMWLLLSLWILKRVEKFTKRKVAPAIETDTKSFIIND
ncbi:MAG: phosphatase PAP2 family protein [Ginsengibacter sp.]